MRNNIIKSLAAAGVDRDVIKKLVCALRAVSELGIEGDEARFDAINAMSYYDWLMDGDGFMSAVYHEVIGIGLGEIPDMDRLINDAIDFSLRFYE